MIKIKLSDMVQLLNLIQETKNMNQPDEIPHDYRVMTNRFVSLTHQEAVDWNNLSPKDRTQIYDVEIEVAVDKVKHLPPFIPKKPEAKILEKIYDGKVEEPGLSEVEKALKKVQKKLEKEKNEKQKTEKTDGA